LLLIGGFLDDLVKEQLRLFVNVQDQNHHLDRFLGEVSYFLEVIKEFKIKYNKDKLLKNLENHQRT
jgi:hypothetical protein